MNNNPPANLAMAVLAKTQNKFPRPAAGAILLRTAADANS